MWWAAARARGDAAWRSGNGGRVLALAARRFAREALALVHREGFDDVGEALIALLRNLDLEGTRLTDLAARARMTKQSMRELVDRAQALDLVARVPDPLDQRAKTIAFTERGLAVLAAFGRAIAITEAEAESMMGAAFIAQSKALLRLYANGTALRQSESGAS
jgi:DNA-binding MarR family transcriptional regulator